MLSGGDISTLVAEAAIVIGFGWFIIYKFWPKGDTVSVANIEVAAGAAATSYGVSNVSVIESTVMSDLKTEIASFEAILNSLDLRVKLIESEIMTKVASITSNVKTDFDKIETTVVNDAKVVVADAKADFNKVETAVVNDAEKIWTDVKKL